jgi:hypothetical protein
LHVRVNVVVVLSAPVLALPLVGSFPDQPPEVVQLLALVEDQLSIETPPALTLLGVALRETVGAVGAVGAVGGTPCPVDVPPEVAWLPPDVSPPQPVSAAVSTEHRMREMISRVQQIRILAIRIQSRPQSLAIAGIANLPSHDRTKDGGWRQVPEKVPAGSPAMSDCH